MKLWLGCRRALCTSTKETATTRHPIESSATTRHPIESSATTRHPIESSAANIVWARAPAQALASPYNPEPLAVGARSRFNHQSDHMPLQVPDTPPDTSPAVQQYGVCASMLEPLHIHPRTPTQRSIVERCPCLRQTPFSPRLASSGVAQPKQFIINNNIVVNMLQSSKI